MVMDKKQECKDLYMAPNWETLHKVAVAGCKEILVNKKSNMLLNSAKKVYIASLDNPQDEEHTYILLCRFIVIFETLMGIEDQNYVDSMLGKEFSNAKARVARLKNNLRNRYEKAKLEEATTKIVTSISPVQQHTVFQGLYITCVELYTAFFEKHVNLLVIDIRDDVDFKESHIKDINCLNIPDSSVKSGLSAHKLGKSLPPRSKEIWDMRARFTVIVLVDWNTTNTNFSASKLDKLRTILIDWDMEVTYEEGPVILNGGYKDWLDIYPMFCTSSVIRYKKANTDLDELLNLDNIEYPDSESVQIPKIPLMPPINDEPEKKDNVDKLTRYQLLKLEESLLRDSTIVLKKIVEYETLCKDLINDSLSISDTDALNEIQTQLNKFEKHMTDLSVIHSQMLRTTSKFVKLYNLDVSFHPDQQQPVHIEILDSIAKLRHKYRALCSEHQSISKDRQRLLEMARKAKKPILVPEIDRTTKPKNLSDISIKHIEGKLRAVINGTTGLTNIKNTCYMNALIQCLRHVPFLMDLFCRGGYTDLIKKKNPLITKEFGHLVRSLWSSSYSVIKPQEFYDKFTSLVPSFKNGRHEDCMEFFVYLLNHLVQDSAVDVKSESYWSERERAWNQQHLGKHSVYLELFYHQIRVEYLCKCGLRSLKFDIDNVFYVPVPDHRFDLQSSMISLLSSTETATCKKCQIPKESNKTICLYPSALIVVLKRYIFDNQLIRKNEAPCDFPLKNLKVGQAFYDLDSIALHSGNSNYGHYTAVCRNLISKEWIRYNDEEVSSVDICDDVIKIQAYALFYSKTTDNSNM